MSFICYEIDQIFYKIIILLCTHLFVILNLFSIADQHFIYVRTNSSKWRHICKQTSKNSLEAYEIKILFDRRLFNFFFNRSQLILNIVICDIYCKIHTKQFKLVTLQCVTSLKVTPRVSLPTPPDFNTNMYGRLTCIYAKTGQANEMHVVG